jgi:hypothetical protein
VHELQKIATDQAAIVANEERFGSANLFCAPSPELVRRLVDRGYSENAARRAVMMTGNSGYNDALGWAVMHTMDPNFNQPVAILKPENKLYVDEEAILLLNRSLEQISRVLEDPSIRAKLIQFIESQHKDLETSYGIKGGTRSSNFGRKPQLEHKAVSQKKKPPPPPPPAQKKEKVAVTNSLSNTVAPSVSQPNANGSSATVRPPVNQLITQNRPSQAPTVAASESRAVVSYGPPPSSTGATPSVSGGLAGRTPSLIRSETKAQTSRTTLDRLELRRRGQEALEKLRSTPSKGESRRRLIEEGRQLLKQAKTASSSVVTGSGGGATTTSSTTRLGSVRPLPPVAPPVPTTPLTSTTTVGKNDSSLPTVVPAPAASLKGPALLRTQTKPPVAPARGGSSTSKVIKIDPTEDDNDDGGWDFDDF